MDQQQLGAVATEIIHAFQFVDGQPHLSDADTARWAMRLAGGIDDAAAVARDLVAFAVRLSLEHPQISADAIGTLLGLAGIVLADVQHVQAAFVQQGGTLGSAAAARAIGLMTSSIPVSARAATPGAVSPLQARFPTKDR